MSDYIDLTLDSNDIKLLVVDQGDGTYKLSVDADLAVGDTLGLSAGEAHIGQVGGEGITIAQTPTVTAGAYSAADVVGGLLTFANASRVSEGGGVIKNVIIIDDSKQNVEMELWLFKETFTAIADNGAWNPSATDLEKLIGVITTSDGTWYSTASQGVADVESSKRYDLTGTSMFGQLVTRGTPTYASTSAITVKLALLQD